VIFQHPYGQRTLAAIFHERVDSSPDRTFLIDDLGNLSWAEAWDQCSKLASGFQKIGIGRGDYVGLMLGNRREFVLTWFALAMIGAIEVPIPVDSVASNLYYLTNHTGLRVVVLEADYLDRFVKIQPRPSSLELMILVSRDSDIESPWSYLDFDELLQDTKLSCPVEVTYADQVAVMYTSGSTGLPKGAILSHGHHYVNGAQAAQVLDLSESDVIYVCTPLYHNQAQGYGIWPALVSGASVRIAKRFSASGFWEDVRHHKATILPFVGAMLVILAKQHEKITDQKNPLRIGYGIPIPTSLHEVFEERFDLELIHLYGSTEATILSWNTGPDRKIGSAGRPLSGYEVSIRDRMDIDLPEDSIGEICVRTTEPFGMFSGYHNDPERTVEAFRNLWFHTGDQGRLDEDGFLWFVDRLGDTIRRRGENISSLGIEAIVSGFPGVNLVAVFGVPSDLTEEEVMIAVTPKSGKVVDPGEFLEWCKERIPKNQIPRYIDIRDELPLTSTGKIEKVSLKQTGVTNHTIDLEALDRIRQI
jgi:crotonobetaine/carnitine-CoA ligase